MKNGFTLLELIITLSILAILMTVAAPSFSGLLERALIERTTTEFRGLFVQAKSEAVMRNSTVYIHTVGLSGTPTKTDNWCIIVSKNLTETSCTAATNIISIIQGENLNGLTISRDPNYPKIGLDGIRSWPIFNSGDLEVDFLMFYKDENKPITMYITMLGRLRTCSVGGEWYGFNQCV
ncbi:GspH/FimT family pseudopilin [Photobacterium profundum]|uniref:GspH/FimT family pseudopilin n=1 Tax=Photobacterium profundum TaxID=74109 RepID=UPI003D0DFE4B